MERIVRNKRIAVNIKTSGVMRALSILVNLMLIPILLQFLGERNYGIWLTISSFLGWSTLLDLGVGNGLKNRLTEAMANDDHESLSLYSSSAYAILSIVATAAFALFTALVFIIDWNALLNVPEIPIAVLRTVLILFFFFFCVKLVLNQVLNIAASKLFTSIADVVNLLINVGLLVGVFVIWNLPIDRLLGVSMVFGIVPVLVLVGVSVWAFNGHFKAFSPNLGSIDWKKGKDVMSLGSKFFFIQLAGIILFSTDNLIISHFMDPSAVTGYHISFRYFGVAIMLFSLLTTPIWPAYTDAYQNEDMSWIRSITQRLVKVWLLLALTLVIMLFLAPHVYRLWIGEGLDFPWSMNFMMAFYALSITWGTIFVTFINSTGKLRLQMIFSIVAGVVNIPLSIFFIRYTDLGASGVMLATIICISYGPLISIIQYKKILTHKAKGIWNK